MATTIIVKINHGTEIRRFTSNKETLTWSALSKRAVELFELTNKNFKMTYTDDEGDRITLSSDAELAEAAELALTTSPAVLRLAVTVNESTIPPTKSFADPDVGMRDAASEADPNPPSSTAGNHGPAAAPRVDESLATFLNAIKTQLPAALAQMPESMRHFLPHAELDIAATVAANAAANASSAAASAAAKASSVAASAVAAEARKVAEAASNVAASAAATCPFAPTGPVAVPVGDEPPVPGVHVGVSCDKTGQCPIVGNRYHLVGHNYDLCEAEFEKLGAKEKAMFQKVPPPSAPAAPINIDNDPRNNPCNDPRNHHGAGNTGAGAHVGVHPFVTCDKTGQCPIVGMRYHLRGHNYDLCQAEFDKLSPSEKLQYDAVPPPEPCGPWAPQFRRWGPNGPGCNGWGRGHRANNGGNNGGGNGCAPNNCKLAARFVRDVSIFDGTQMAPGTAFTKIWRLKNVGEVPWPPGTRMLFVGGDAMSPTEMSVPLSRAGPVFPGEEVDVAVEMVAPQELGRYLGYWRLVGPLGRRKFGQRVWCHIQVVDDTEASTTLGEEELQRAAAEIASKKSALASEIEGADPHDEPTDDTTTNEVAPPAEATVTVAPSPMTVDGEPLPSDGTQPPSEAAAAESVPATIVVAPSHESAVESATDNGATDDGGKSDDDMVLVDKEPSTSEPPDAAAAVKAQLAAMGFDEPGMIEAALAKYGADLGECARSLAAATEWDSLLDDLAEMGFEDRALNKQLMLKHAGNIKRTVKELVEDA